MKRTKLTKKQLRAMFAKLHNKNNDKRTPAELAENPKIELMRRKLPAEYRNRYDELVQNEGYTPELAHFALKPILKK